MSTNKLNKITSNLNSNVNPSDLVNAEVIRYKSFDGLEIPAILYRPHQASKLNKVPALVWVHGGPGGQSRVGYRALIQYLVNLYINWIEFPSRNYTIKICNYFHKKLEYF